MTLCVAEGDPCGGGNGECCGELICDAGQPEPAGGDSVDIGFCTREAGCELDGTPCPANPRDCCADHCSFGICQPCVPLGQICIADEECCSGEKCVDGICGGMDCLGFGEMCHNGLGTCCSTKCDGLYGCCVVPIDLCSHDVCTESPNPLDPSCPTGLPNEPVVGQCVAAVCEADPYCCCVGWDQTCIGLATSLTECGVACASETGN